MLTRTLFVLALCCSIAFAADSPTATSGPANEASIRQLLELTHARNLVDAMMAQMDQVMKNAMQQATQGKTVSPEAQKIFDQCRTEVIAALRQEFTWEKLEPLYQGIYQKSFSQAEVEGMIGFYKTPAGQAVISKMPVVMKNTMNEMVQMMGPMMQRVERMQHDVTAQLAAPKAKKGG